MQHQKDRQYFQASRDLCAVAEEGDASFVEDYNQSYLSHVLDSTVYNKPSFESIGNTANGCSVLPMRRARAGTMPSLDSTPPQLTPSIIMPSASLSFLNNRHRSGSLNLPTYNGWSSTVDPNFSPTSSELPQGDDIARTLRSLGLDDDKDTESSRSPLSVASTHLATPPIGSVLPLSQQKQQRSTLRSRSYSVNNTAIYQTTPSSSSFINGLYSAPHPLPSLSVDPIPLSSNRPRASSMSRMDHNNRMNISSLWKMQLGTLHDDPAFPGSPVPPPPAMEPSLSLGDSEFLANIIHQNNKHVNRNTDIENNSMTLHQFMPMPIGSLSSSMLSNSNASRSLWVGNIDGSMTVDELTSFFSQYGSVESTRLLLEKECAFINFYHLEDAIHAKEDILTNLGGRIGSCIVRVGFGRTENVIPNTTTLIEQPVVSQPTRALWLGNLPTGTTQASLQRVFSLFGPIESIRVLIHKNCAFINFETSRAASAARDALVQNDASVQEFWGIRLGFAKVPSNSNLKASDSKYASSTSIEEVMIEHREAKYNQELWYLMSQLGAQDSAIELLKAFEPFSYRDSIPSVPEYGLKRKHDIGKLRDIRKKLDNCNKEDVKQADAIALDCMNEMAEICSDYIGNTVAQRLFERCSENVKTMMLEIVAPHLAALGIHKNGTWAAQKIIDSMTTPKQIQIVFANIQPYIPALLLDQFGNYVVQCCLRLKGNTQFIMNAMVEKCLLIAQGRFGVRAVRGILESDLVNTSQRILIMAALLQNATSLAIHSNGALLVSWLIDCSSMQNRHCLLATQLMPQFVDVATHKLGSQILLKLINQDVDQEAKQLILKAMLQLSNLQAIVSDQSRGLGLTLKLLSSDYLSEDEKRQIKEPVCAVLKQLSGTEYGKALADICASNESKALLSCK
ncbi:armadillo-type protein [Choanephora cucurbitarum]|nr:armadillo-type protein [Choanephora cucurbitarum]